MSDDNKTIASALKELEAKTADKSEIVPLLKQIERNTAKSVSSASVSISRAVEKAVVKASIKSEKRQKVSVAGKRQVQASTAIVASSKATKPTKQQASMPGMPRKINNSQQARNATTPVVQSRDRAGKFTAKAPAKDVVAEQRQKEQNDKLTSILKDAVMQRKEGLKNVAGKLVFGPLWDVGKELKEAADDMKDNAKEEKSTMGRMLKWGKGKLGVKDPIKVKEAKANGKAKFGNRLVTKQQTRKEATAKGTTQMSGGGSSQGGGILDTASNLSELWKNRKGVSAKPGTFAGRRAAGAAARGGGMMARGAGVMRAGGASAMRGAAGLARLAAPLVAGLSLPLIAAGTAAAFGIQQMTKALITGESDVNKWFKKITGLDAGKDTPADKDASDKQNVEYTEKENKRRVAAGKKALEYDPVTGQVKQGAVAEAQESGGGDRGAGVISSGKNDAGGKSYGLKQFSSAKGKNGKSSLGEYAKNSKYADEFKGLEPGSAEFDKKWKEIDKRDNKGFAADQRAYTSKTMTAPVRTVAADKGFDTKDVGINEALISQSVNHGPKGNKKILSGAEAELAKQYGSVSAAPKEAQLDAIYKSRKSYVNSVADGNDVEAQKLRAKGEEAKAQKKEGEAKQLRRMAGDGGRYDQELSQTKALSASGGKSSGNAAIDKRREPAVAKDKSASGQKASEAAPSEAAPAKSATAPAKSATAPAKSASGQKASEAAPAANQAVATEPEKKAEAATAVAPVQEKQDEKATATAVGEAVAKSAPALPAPDPKAEQSRKLREAWAKQEGKSSDWAEMQSDTVKGMGKDPDAWFESRLNLDTKQQMKLSDATGKPVAQTATAPALPPPDPKAEQSKKIKEAWAKQQGKTLEQADQQASVLKTTGKDPDEYFKSKLNLDTKQQMGLAGADSKPVAQTATAIAQPTYADKDKAIQDKRSAAIEKITADTTLTDDQKKQKKAEARATAAKETQALQAEDIANNDKINADLDAKSATGTATVAAPEQQQSVTEPASATGTATVPGSAAAAATEPGGKTYSKDQVDKAKAESDGLENQRQAILTKAKGAGSAEERDALYKQSDTIKAKREEKDAIVKKDKDESLAAQAGTVDFLGNPIGQQPPAATVPAVSATQPPLPQPQAATAPSPRPVEVPGIEKLAAASNEQKAAKKDNSGGGKAATPNIKTDFDDTMLVLMSYDRI